MSSLQSCQFCVDTTLVNSFDWAPFFVLLKWLHEQKTQFPENVEDRN